MKEDWTQAVTAVVHRDESNHRFLEEIRPSTLT